MSSFIFRWTQRISGFLADLFCMAPITPVIKVEPGVFTKGQQPVAEKEKPIMTRDQKIAEVAGKLGIHPSWLSAVIAFESGYDPQIKAGMPYNQKKVSAGLEEPKYARGLIQFIDPTAQELGFLDAEQLVQMYPDFNSQMDGPVYDYFKKYMPYTTEQSVYLAVFYPAYRNKPLNWTFPDSVQAANPRIVTVGDYVNKVKNTALARGLAPAGGIAAVVLLVLAWRYLS